jgi:hypothetical protein
MVAFAVQRVSVRGTPVRAVSNGSRTVMAADRPIWLPGNQFPKRKLAVTSFSAVAALLALLLLTVEEGIHTDIFAFLRRRLGKCQTSW